MPTAPPELVPLLRNYLFPGNIRELRAMVYDAVSQHSAGISLRCGRLKNRQVQRGGSAALSPTPAPGQPEAAS